MAILLDAASVGTNHTDNAGSDDDLNPVVQLNGINMVLIGTRDYQFSTNKLLAYYATNPTVGDSQLSVSFGTTGLLASTVPIANNPNRLLVVYVSVENASGPSTDIQVNRFNFYNVAQGTYEARAIAATNSNSITTLSSGALILYGGGNGSQLAMSTPTDFTQAWMRDVTGHSQTGGYYVKPTAGLQAVNVDNAQGIIAVAFPEAAGGGGAVNSSVTPTLIPITVLVNSPTAVVNISSTVTSSLATITVLVNGGTASTNASASATATPSLATVTVLVNTPTINISVSAIATPSLILTRIVVNDPTLKISQSRIVNADAASVTITVLNPSISISTGGVGLRVVILVKSKIDKFLTTKSRIEKYLYAGSRIDNG